VENVFKTLSKDLSGTGLQALVNNAGIGIASVVELQPFEDFEKVIQVNLLGHVFMTKTFLPLLRKAKSARIINIASVAGFLSPASSASYSASKFGIEGLSDALRRELSHLNISVSIIEPGFAKTPIIATGLQNYISRIISITPPELYSVYEQVFPRNVDSFIRNVHNDAMEPSLVVEAVEHAFTSPQPRTRYLVGVHAKIMAVLVWVLPTSMLDWLLDLYWRRLIK